jgi:hypothetical protein
MKGPKIQTPPLKQLKKNMGNCVIIMPKSETAKLTTSKLAGDFRSFVFEKR